MALCYIARLQRTKPHGTRLNARILVLTGSVECASQYMTYMNVFFTAQKQGIALDVCALDKAMTLLQQGCDITGGQYLRLPQLDGLLQYLLWVFLPDPQTRNKLVLPPPTKVDYRAACFCHRELIDIGFVCSVCLSIFCKFSPICTTCQWVQLLFGIVLHLFTRLVLPLFSTVFKTPAPIAGKAKKKKKELGIWGGPIKQRWGGSPGLRMCIDFVRACRVPRFIRYGYGPIHTASLHKRIQFRPLRRMGQFIWISFIKLNCWFY